MLHFAVKLGARGSEFFRDDVIRLRTLDFAEERILECVVVTALKNFANTLQMGLGIEPDFAPPPAFEENKVHLSSVARTPM
jgi:alkylhydroperoxidase family enzyme